MSRYDFFESGLGLFAARLGIIPVDLLTKYDSYKTYKDLLAEGKDQAEARKQAAINCRCHYASIVRAIYWFEEPETEVEEPLRVRSWRSRKFANP